MLEKSRPAIALIERMIKASAVVGFDESGCYTNGKLNWSWIGQTTKDVQTLLRGAIHLRNENPDEVIPKDSWLTRLDELLKKNLDSLRKEFNELKRGIIRCRDYIFNFLENPAIPSDNNASERGIRKLKVKQKISGCFRSGTGADAFHALHSIADTAWKNGQSPLDAILALV